MRLSRRRVTLDEREKIQVGSEFHVARGGAATSAIAAERKMRSSGVWNVPCCP